jgi:hypothetical protein
MPKSVKTGGVIDHVKVSLVARGKLGISGKRCGSTNVIPPINANKLWHLYLASAPIMTLSQAPHSGLQARQERFCRPCQLNPLVKTA